MSTNEIIFILLVVLDGIIYLIKLVILYGYIFYREKSNTAAIMSCAYSATHSFHVPEILARLTLLSETTLPSQAESKQYFRIY